MNQTPRWKHKCPACPKIVFWEKVYCHDCIKKDPRKGNFRMTRRLLSYRKGPLRGLLPGMKMSRHHLFAMVRELSLCVECGHKVKLNDLRHRCYFLAEAVVRPLLLIKCRVCRFDRAKHLFPQFTRRGKVLRARICSDCLHDSELIPVHKRKYERRVHA